jgi:hypothetical protein
MVDSTDFPYACEVEIILPSTTTAVDLMRIMSVDKEVGDRVLKTFHVVPSSTPSDAAPATGTLVVRFQATEAKMLRVSVSSFAEYLQVALKCYQEFDTSVSLRN